MEWTTEAKQALHSYVHNATSQPATSDVYQDLYTDLRAHVEEELHQKDIVTINLNSLNLVLQSMGNDEFDEVSTARNEADIPPVKSTLTAEKEFIKNQVNSSIASPSRIDKSGGCLSMCAWLGSILLPTLALLIELGTHEARSMFFDPIPTWAHVLFIALVPLSFILIRHFKKNIDQYENGDQRQLKHPKIVTTLFGFTLPVIAYYTILFLPVTPTAIIGCIILLGFLPLAPIFCLIAWLFLGRKLNALLTETKNKSAKTWLKYGILTGLVSLITIEAPSYLRQKAITDSLSTNDETQRQGIENIRRYGGEDTLLHFCYYGNQRTRGFNGKLGVTPAHWVFNFFSDHTVSAKHARQLYYQVTGMPFNTVRPPKSGRGGEFSDWTWDSDHGGDEVAAKTKGLSLHNSRMDMHIDDETKLGYLEWIITFKNDNPTAKEARMQIALPHNGFVSKLTLWVNGEERPAAFSSVSKVKAAYKEIAVRQRLDPVLVNVSGADRVMLQCYPVPADGGLMKMKVGVTFPLCLNQIESGNIHFPYIAEHNFTIPKELKHELYAQADLQINAPNAVKEHSKNIDTLQCSLSNYSLKTERITWKDLTPNQNATLWAKDTFCSDDNKYLIRTSIPKNTPDPRNLIIVVDRSASLQKWKPIIAQLLEQGNPGIQFYVVGDHSNPLQQCTSVSEFEQIEFVGGVDNTPALRKAISYAKQLRSVPASILWIHGAQPVKFPTISGLEQDLERSFFTIPIHSVALEDGANHILQAFKHSPHFKGGCRVVNSTDLIHMAEKIQCPKHQQTYIWKRAIEAPQNGTEVWDQLVRKWAHETTIRSLSFNESSFVSFAHNPPLPATYQIVTPVSGAVVLESKAQYEQTGLGNPTGQNAPSIPAVPEPSSSLLILIGAFITTVRRSRQVERRKN